MQMKRLGETAVSPDGKWLAYSVTTVNLDQNTKDTELWLQPIEGRRAPQARRRPARRLGPAVLRQMASASSSSPAGERPADLARRLRFRHRRTSNRAEADQHLRPKPTMPNGRPTASPSSSPPLFIPIARRSRRPTSPPGRPLQRGPRQGRRRQQGQGADLHSSALPALEPLHRRQALAISSSSIVASGAIRDLTPNDPHDVPPVLASRRRRLRHLARLKRTGLH